MSTLLLLFGPFPVLRRRRSYAKGIADPIDSTCIGPGILPNDACVAADRGLKTKRGIELKGRAADGGCK